MSKFTHILIFVTALFFPCTIIAQQTIVLIQSDLPYSEQTWHYAGYGNQFPGSEVKKNWDKDKRITSLAYTGKGWFFAMSKGTGIGMQTYKNDASFPKSWIEKNWKEDYYITSVARSPYQWTVVMSKGEGYTNQSYITNTWMNVSTWIAEKWEKNYYITDVCYSNNNYWTVVMSKHSKFSGQGYLWIANTNDMNRRIQSEVWDKGYRVQLIEYGAGGYIVVYCKYSNGNTPAQGYSVNNSDLRSYIKTAWNESKKILYIGGGLYSGTIQSPPSSKTKSISSNPSTPAKQPSQQPSQPGKQPSQQPSQPAKQPSQQPSQPTSPSGAPMQRPREQSRSTTLFGLLASYNITSCVDLQPYGLNASYGDWGGGMVFNHKNIKSKKASNEFIMSFIMTSTKTIPTDDMVKFIFPMDLRWFRGWDGFQFYFGIGLQYNCFISAISKERNNGYYDSYLYDMYYNSNDDWDLDFDAHQLSANFQGGVLLFNSESKVHVLLGGKWHQPMVGGSMGTYLGNNGRIDFSQDKKTIVFAATLSFTIGESVLMLEYNLPLGGGKRGNGQPSISSTEPHGKPSFFEGKSQSFTITWLFGG